MAEHLMAPTTTISDLVLSILQLSKYPVNLSETVSNVFNIFLIRDIFTENLIAYMPLKRFMLEVNDDVR